MRDLDIGRTKSFPGGANVPVRVKCSNPVILKVGSLDQHQHCLGTCQKCRFLACTPDLLNQKLVF